VLIHALARRFTPSLPRLAVDSYWRAHPVRADRLARALACRSGAPAGWRWRLVSGGTAPHRPWMPMITIRQANRRERACGQPA